MRRMTTILLAGAAVWLTSFDASAVVISIDPFDQTVALGDPVSVDVNISGLASSGAPSLGAFDIDLSFDSSLLAVSSFTVTSHLGDFALGEALDVSFGLVAPGVFNVAVLSLLEPDSGSCIICMPPYLDDIQPADFTLFTITFDTLGAGTSHVGLPLVVLADGFGADLTEFEFVKLEADITIEGPSTGVPEPTTLVLLGAGLLGVALRRRRAA